MWTATDCIEQPNPIADDRSTNTTAVQGTLDIRANTTAYTGARLFESNCSTKDQFPFGCTGDDRADARSICLAFHVRTDAIPYTNAVSGPYNTLSNKRPNRQPGPPPNSRTVELAFQFPDLP